MKIIEPSEGFSNYPKGSARALAKDLKENMKEKYDMIIIGSGIIGLTLALIIKRWNPKKTILILDKERDVAYHASGRNSGVLHAGFYYSADSLKAKFTVIGNRLMKDYCRLKDIPMNECGKLVVAQNEEELKQLYELEKRGQRNGAKVSLIEENQALGLEPNIKTYKKALYSPNTATIDSIKVCQAIKEDLLNFDVNILFETKYLSHQDNIIKTNKGDFIANKIINCAGLYADRIAQDFGFGKNYTMIPFKGLYLKYKKNKTDINMNIYPVPNLKNPFLGVHFTKTVYGDIKIGPTAIPAFWRENYQNLSRFDFSEFLEILYYEMNLLVKNSFQFRDLAFAEMRKYNKAYFINLALRLVRNIDPQGFSEFTNPGIRAQLLDKKTLRLVQDFVVEGDKNSVHILNAVSPAFTCAFSFSEFVLKNHLAE